MGAYWIVLGVIALAAVLPLVMEIRLRSRHPEEYRSLVEGMIADEVKPKRFRSELLWRFMTQRRHKALNDPALSVLSDGMLAAMAVFVVACIGGLVWVFGQKAL